MGALTLAQYQTRVRLACGNVPDAHPVIAEGMHTTAINNAPNTLIRENPDLFPEHQNNTWTVGPTIVGNNLVELPVNLLILERVTCSQDVVVVGSDWTTVQEYSVVLIKGHVIGLIDKPATTTGYPTMCDRKANALLYNVTTQTGFTTFFRLYGVAGEVPLVGAGETFRMHRDFDKAIIQYATAETLEMMGQYDRAMEVLTAAERGLQKQRGVVARERAARPMRMRVDWLPPL